MSKLPTLYGMDLSPPVRACLLTLNALDVQFNYKVVNLMTQEHLEEPYRKHNPQHTVPMLEDDGVFLWDSHAICAYLVGKYGKDDQLYPKDLVKRAVVDQRMYFDASILFMSLRNVSMPMFMNNITVVLKEKTKNISEGYNLLEDFLKDTPYLCGDKLTIADFCCVATVTSMRAVVELKKDRYPRITKWIELVQSLPYYQEANGKGAAEYVNVLKSRLTDIIV